MIDTRPSHVVHITKPRPGDREDLDVEWRTLKPEEWGGDHEILIEIHYADDLLPEDITTLRGQRVTTATRTLLDMATRSTDAEFSQMLDNALARRLTTTDQLRRAIARHPQHEGGPRLDRFLNERATQ
jgi:hypothetical protein